MSVVLIFVALSMILPIHLVFCLPSKSKNELNTGRDPPIRGGVNRREVMVSDDPTQRTPTPDGIRLITDSRERELALQQKRMIEMRRARRRRRSVDRQSFDSYDLDEDPTLIRVPSIRTSVQQTEIVPSMAQLDDQISSQLTQSTSTQ